MSVPHASMVKANGLILAFFIQEVDSNHLLVAAAILNMTMRMATMNMSPQLILIRLLRRGFLRF